MTLSGQFTVPPASTGASTPSSRQQQQHVQNSNANPPKAIFLKLSTAALKQLQIQYAQSGSTGMEIELGRIQGQPAGASIGAGASASSRTGAQIPLAINLGEMSYALSASTSTSSSSSSISTTTSLLRQVSQPRKSGSTTSSAASLTTLLSLSNSSIYSSATEPTLRKPREKTAENMAERMRERKEQLQKEKEGKRIVMLDDMPVAATAGKTGLAKRGRPKGSTNASTLKAGASPLLRASAIAVKGRSPSPHSGSPIIGASPAKPASKPKTNRLVASEAAKGLMSRKEKEQAALAPTSAPSDQQQPQQQQQSNAAEKNRMASSTSDTSSSAHTSGSNTSNQSVSTSATTLPSGSKPIPASSTTSSQSVRPSGLVSAAVAAPASGASTQTAATQRRYHQRKTDDSDLASSESSDDDEDKVPLMRRLASPEKSIAPAQVPIAPHPIQASSSRAKNSSNQSPPTQSKLQTSPPVQAAATGKGAKAGGAKKVAKKVSQSITNASSIAATAAKGSPDMNSKPQQSPKISTRPADVGHAPSAGTGASIMISSRSQSSSGGTDSRSSSASPAPRPATKSSTVDATTQKRKRSDSAAIDTAQPVHTKAKHEDVKESENSTLQVQASGDVRNIASPVAQTSATARAPSAAARTAGGSRLSKPLPRKSTSLSPARSTSPGADGSRSERKESGESESKPTTEEAAQHAKDQISPPQVKKPVIAPLAVPTATDTRPPSPLPSPNSSLHPLPPKPGKTTSVPTSPAASPGPSASNNGDGDSGGGGKSPNLAPLNSVTARTSSKPVSASSMASTGTKPLATVASGPSSSLSSKPLPPGLPPKPSTVIPPYGLKRSGSSSSLHTGHRDDGRDGRSERERDRDRDRDRDRSRASSSAYYGNSLHATNGQGNTTSGNNSPIVSHFPVRRSDASRDGRSSAAVSPRVLPADVSIAGSAWDGGSTASDKARNERKRKSPEREKATREQEKDVSSRDKKKKKKKGGLRNAEIHFTSSEEEEDAEGESVNLDDAAPLANGDGGEEGELPEEGEEVEVVSSSYESASRGRTSEPKEVHRTRDSRNGSGGSSGTGTGTNARLSSVGGLSFNRKGGNSRTIELRKDATTAAGSSSNSRANTPDTPFRATVQISNDSDFVHYSRRFNEDLYPSYERLYKRLEEMQRNLAGATNGRDKNINSRESVSVSEMRRLVEETNDRGKELMKIKTELARYNEDKMKKSSTLAERAFPAAAAVR